MVSQMQKDEMNRQSHLAAVKSEKIEILNIGLKNDRGVWNQSPFNITENQSWNNWSSVTLTLVNLNTDDVKVTGIAINNNYARNYSIVTDMPFSLSSQNLSKYQYLTIPGTKSQKIQINFTDDYPKTTSTDSKIHVRIMTSIFNTFEKTFKPPNPVFETRIEIEDLGVTQRDVIVLDGSRSTADNSVVQWDWTIEDHNNATVVENTTSGKVVRWNPLSPGPFRVRLTVTDDAGMTRTSSPVDIPINSRFMPPANLNAEFDNSSKSINVSVKDIVGNPLSNITVTYVKVNNPDGNLTLENSFSTTDSNGTTTVNVCKGQGTVKVVYGKLPQPEIPVNVGNVTLC
jgi:hypothetical protein